MLITIVLTVLTTIIDQQQYRSANRIAAIRIDHNYKREAQDITRVISKAWRDIKTFLSLIYVEYIPSEVTVFMAFTDMFIKSNPKLKKDYCDLLKEYSNTVYI